MSTHRHYKRESEKIFNAYEYHYLQHIPYSKDNKRAMNRQMRTLIKRDAKKELRKYR